MSKCSVDEDIIIQKRMNEITQNDSNKKATMNGGLKV